MPGTPAGSQLLCPGQVVVSSSKLVEDAAEHHARRRNAAAGASFPSVFRIYLFTRMDVVVICTWNGSIAAEHGCRCERLVSGCRAALDPPSYVDSSEVVEGADLGKNGLRIRIKTYFNRQRAVDVPVP